LVSNAFIGMYILLCILQIFAKEVDFWLYEDSSCLEKAEKEDQFPPRFNVKLNCPNPSYADTLNLDYKIHHKIHGKTDRELLLNIFIPDSTSAQSVDCFTGTDIHIYICGVMYKNSTDKYVHMYICRKYVFCNYICKHFFVYYISLLV